MRQRLSEACRARQEEEAYVDKSALTSHVWTENHEMQKGEKLLKGLKHSVELAVWEKISFQKNVHKTLNFDILKDSDLIKKFVKQPETSRK